MTIPELEFTHKADKKIGVEIIELSELYQRYENTTPNFMSRRHRISFYNLLYVTKGSAKHFIDFNTYSIQAGSTVFINKGQIHAFDEKQRLEGKLIVFTDTFLHSIFESIKTPIFSPTHLLASYVPAFTIDSRTRQSCDALLVEIKKEYELDKPSTIFIQLLFSALLVKLTTARPDIYEKHLSESRAELFTQFIHLLEQQFTITRDAKAYAAMLNSSYKSLNQACKLAANQTAKQLIDAHTILEAKRKLSISDTRVQQLAFDMGFDDATNFVKYFKKHTLQTPSQFKKYING